MESIYKPSEFFCTEPIDVQKHFADFSRLLQETDSRASTIKENLSHLMGDVKQSKVNQLHAMCSIEKLDCGKEPEPMAKPDIIKSQLKLNVHYPVTPASKKNLRTIVTKEKLKDDPQSYAKYRHQVRQEFETDIIKREASSKPLNLRPNKDVVYTIRIYQPFFFKFTKKNYYKNCRYGHEIVALGSNTLAEVRDKILCKSDIGICQEIEEVPSSNFEAAGSAPAKVIYPSNFIFIENVFYNDLRRPNAIDYSEVVMQWAEKWKVGKFKTAEMDKVKLSELKIRLGYPYMYQHQADCEHILVFSEVRLLKGSDFLCKKDYPFYKSVARYSSQLCMMCGLSAARWICIGSPRLPYDNTFLCQQCCVSYNYINDIKLDSVKIYPYFDKSTIL